MNHKCREEVGEQNSVQSSVLTMIRIILKLPFIGPAWFFIKLEAINNYHPTLLSSHLGQAVQNRFRVVAGQYKSL